MVALVLRFVLFHKVVTFVAVLNVVLTIFDIV
jgi:hypothetical protein